MVSGARELDRVVGEGGLVLRRRRADASAAAVAAVTRAVQHGATTDASELCAPLGPSSAARADASPRIAPCARGFYRFVDGDERAFAGDCILRAARPTSPQRSPASQAASWQYAGIARGSGKRDSQSDTCVSSRRFRSDADVITSRRLKTRWETRAPWTGAIVIPVLSASRTHRGQRFASDFCCALPRTAARRSKAATGAATASTCSLQLGLACGCSGAASRRRGRIYRSTREDSTTNGPRQQTRPRRVVVSNAADYKICGCGDALLSDCFLLR